MVSNDLMTDQIVIKGAREHNLKGIDLEVPHRRLVVVTGVSGSGKSSLAYDTIFRESQRRVLESFSPRARQALGQLHRPNVEQIEGLPAALAVDQMSIARSSRSTVGTITELYTSLRLLFSRVGEREGRSDHGLLSTHFSFNSPEGACPKCSGLGFEDTVDPDLLVADPAKSLREGALVPTLPNGYIMYSQVTLDVLDRVCQAHQFSVDIPWRELTPEQQRVVLYGSDRILVPYGKHPLESRLRWKGITPRPREEGNYKGIVPTLDEIIKRKRNVNVLRFVRTRRCAACEGARLAPEALSITIDGRNIADLAALSLIELRRTLESFQLDEGAAEIAKAIVGPARVRLEVLEALGLGYLELRRTSTSLSRGESQRLRLATQVVGGLQGVLYVLDEPSVGLHSSDIHRLITVLRSLCERGSSVVVVEHAPEAIYDADWLIDIGPGPGEAGGELLHNGPTPWAQGRAIDAELVQRSPTFALASDVSVFKRKGTGHADTRRELILRGATLHNLEELDVSFLQGALNVVTGVSGAGKTTLLFGVLVPTLRAHLENDPTKPPAIAEIDGVEPIEKLITIDQSPIGKTPRSNPATYTKVFDRVRDLFSKLPEARERGLSKSAFSMNVKGGRCEVCHGAGVRTVGMHFLGDVEVTCEACAGRRFGPEVLSVHYHEHSISDVLDLSVDAATQLLSSEGAITRVLRALSDVGLGYLKLGQPSTTLSGGEAQRVKLAGQLARPAPHPTLYVLDEPTVGLHQADVRALMKSLDDLVEAGHTVIVIEHDLDVIASAHRVVDLGPGSGADGGRLVAVGSPEEVSRAAGSLTGAALRARFDGSSTLNQKRSHRTAPSPTQSLTLRNVTTHNLKGIDVSVPHRSLTVITGLSGSGKSSLAIDTIAELGRQAYAESLSSYARRFIRGRREAQVEEIRGLSPVIVVDSRQVGRNPRSTVGTMTGILDALRLLYARAGTRRCPKCEEELGENAACRTCDFVGRRVQFLTAQHFSFNTENGACPHCKGLGQISTCDPERLITDSDRAIADWAMAGHKVGKYYGDPKGQHMAILEAVGVSLGLELSRPWRELDRQTRDIVLFGTGDDTYDVTWRYSRRKRTGEHRWTTTWPGLCALVDEEYERKHADRRARDFRQIMGRQKCPQCHGDRLDLEIGAVTFDGRTLPKLLGYPAEDILRWLSDLADSRGSRDVPPHLLQLTDPVRDETCRRLSKLLEVGLGYLRLDQRAEDLSGGEAQRIRIAAQLNAGLCGMTYVFDEPTRGLHHRDIERLICSLQTLRDAGNTVIVVEHDLEVINAADHLIELGPGAGHLGGYVVEEGRPHHIERHGTSATARSLRARGRAALQCSGRTLTSNLAIRGASARNLQSIDVAIPSQGLVAITGVSGSGKSALLFDVIAVSARASRPVGCASIEGLEGFNSVITVDQRQVNDSATSTPATHCGVFGLVRAAFARTAESRARRYGASRFSFMGKTGQCTVCRGLGRERIEMGFLPDLWVTCKGCNGARYDQATLDIRYGGLSIADVLGLSFEGAHSHFGENETIASQLGVVCDVGLGYLQLGQPCNTLSGGESQRLKLATELISTAHLDREGRLYLLDEPTTGLHDQEVDGLVRMLTSLVDVGHTVMIIEHHIGVIARADCVIDLGPEGGAGGGRVVAAGSPRDIAQNPASHTGRALRERLLID